MADVFLSYKSERRKAVEHLAGILRAYGYNVWYDSGLHTGQDFSAQIEKELREAKAVVTLWCRLSVNSEWVKEEAHLAKQLGTAIPALIEPNVALPFGFGLSDTVDLTKWDGSARARELTRFLMQIGQKVGRDPNGNMREIESFEEPWRRYGAPTLAQFALDGEAAKLEAQRSSSRLQNLADKIAARPAQPAATSSSAAPRPDSGTKGPGGLIAALAVAALVAVGGGISLFSGVFRGPAPTPAATASAQVQPAGIQPTAAVPTAGPAAPAVPPRRLSVMVAPDDAASDTLSRGNPVMQQFGRELVEILERNGVESTHLAQIAPDHANAGRGAVDTAAIQTRLNGAGKRFDAVLAYRVGVDLQRIPNAPTLMRPLPRVGGSVLALPSGQAIAVIEPRLGQMAPVQTNCNAACVADALAPDLRAAAAEMARFAIERAQTAAR